MNRTKLSIREQRDLLQWQAELLRLKIVAAHLSEHRGGHRRPTLLLGALPLGSLAVQAVTKPKRWRDKLLLGMAVAAVAWFRSRPH